MANEHDSAKLDHHQTVNQQRLNNKLDFNSSFTMKKSLFFFQSQTVNEVVLLVKNTIFFYKNNNYTIQPGFTEQMIVS